MENVSDTAAVIEAEPAGMRMVSVSLGKRCMKFAWRLGVGSAITAWLFFLQVQENAPPVPYMLWGFAIFGVSAFLAVHTFGITERRVFDTVLVRYTHAQRINRACRWFLPGLAMLAVIWWVQLSSDQFSTYWWYAWPALFPLLVGLGLYMLRSERVLSAAGLYARAQLDAVQAQVREQRKAKLHAVAGSGLFRYIGAAGCLYVAYWLASDSTGKNSGWAALIWVVFAFVLARELGVWLLGIGLVFLAGWALFAGIAALPVSVAVIIGALIIASAVGKK